VRRFKLSVHQYKQALERQFGFADPDMVLRYAEARAAYKRGRISGDEDVFKPCKGCGKKHSISNDQTETKGEQG